MSFHPIQTNIYENNISNNARTQEAILVNNSFKKSVNGSDTGIIPRYFNENILNKTNKFKIHERLKDIKDHNNDTFVSSLSGQRIPMNQFNHNNMVPFFGSNIKQNQKEKKIHFWINDKFNFKYKKVSTPSVLFSIKSLLNILDFTIKCNIIFNTATFVPGRSLMW